MDESKERKWNRKPCGSRWYEYDCPRRPRTRANIALRKCPRTLDRRGSLKPSYNGWKYTRSVAHQPCSHEWQRAVEEGVFPDEKLKDYRGTKLSRQWDRKVPNVEAKIFLKRVNNAKRCEGEMPTTATRKNIFIHFFALEMDMVGISDPMDRFSCAVGITTNCQEFLLSFGCVTNLVRLLNSSGSNPGLLRLGSH